MTPEEIYEKQTGVPATYPFYVHSVGYVKWLEEQNAKLLEACKEAVTFISGVQVDITREDTYANECQTLLEQAIAEAEGQS
jgi:hypothetical protein